jgi:hypothetical protein
MKEDLSFLGKTKMEKFQEELRKASHRPELKIPDRIERETFDWLFKEWCYARVPEPVPDMNAMTMFEKREVLRAQEQSLDERERYLRTVSKRVSYKYRNLFSYLLEQFDVLYPDYGMKTQATRERIEADIDRLKLAERKAVSCLDEK